MRGFRRLIAVACTGLLTIGFAQLPAVPAHADAGVVVIVEEDASRAVVAETDHVVRPGTGCDATTLKADTTELVISNVTEAKIYVFPDGQCTGSPSATLHAFSTRTVPAPDVEVLIPFAGGHKIGVALELEQ